MAVQLLAYVPLLLLSAATSAALAAYAWRRRDAPGAQWLAVMLAGMTAWAGCYAAGLLSHSLDLRLLWLRLNWTGSSLVPMGWLLFALAYAGRDDWITRRTVAALGAVPAVTVALAWTAGFHDLMWTDPRVVDFGAATMLRYEDGLWYSVFDAYTYLVIGAATVVLVGLVVRHRDLYTDQAVALLAGSLFPAVGYLVVLLGFVREGVDITPLTFPVTGVLFGYVIFRGDLMDALSTTAEVGENAAVDSLQDGVLVVDETDEIIEANPAASRLVGGDTLVGDGLGDVPALADIETTGREHTVERRSPDNRVLEVTVTPIDDLHDRNIGHALVVRDITDRKMAREVLAVTNRVLRHNLRNELSIVVSYADIIEERADDERTVESATRIQAAADELEDTGRKARIAEDLLDDRQDRTRVDFARAARAAAEDVRDNHPAADIAVDAPDTAEGLAMPAIERAVRELLRNGAEHAGDDPAVSVTVREERDRIRVSVTDSGAGVPEHEQRVVTDADEDALDHGSGTGLYLVRWLVEWSGGDLSFADEESRVDLRFDAAPE